jgi:hypothetical protein
VERSVAGVAVDRGHFVIPAHDTQAQGAWRACSQPANGALGGASDAFCSLPSN